VAYRSYNADWEDNKLGPTTVQVQGDPPSSQTVVDSYVKANRTEFLLFELRWSHAGGDYLGRVGVFAERIHRQRRPV